MVAPDGLESKATENHRKPVPRIENQCQDVPRTTFLTSKEMAPEDTKETISIHPQWPKIWYQNTADSNSK